jgi:hypothetical protein
MISVLTNKRVPVMGIITDLYARQVSTPRKVATLKVINLASLLLLQADTNNVINKRDINLSIFI